MVCPGTYGGASNWVNVNKALTLSGENRNTTIIDAGGNAVVPVILSADDVTFSGFTVQGSTLEAVYPQGSHNTITDNIIQDNATGIYANPGTPGVQSNVTVSNNDIHGNGTATAGAGGLYFASNGLPTFYGSGIVITGNQVYDNWANGIDVEGTTGAEITDNQVSNTGNPTGGDWAGIGTDMALNFGAGGTISGNTVSNGGRGGIALWETNGTTVEDNDVTGEPSWGVFVGSVGSYGDNATDNTITGNTLTANGQGIGQWASDPGLVTGTAAHFNTLSGNGQGIANSMSTVIDATNNWWGAASGPSYDNPSLPDACGLNVNNAAGAGDGVSPCVEFAPWLGMAPSDIMNAWGDGTNELFVDTASHQFALVYADPATAFGVCTGTGMGTMSNRVNFHGRCSENGHRTLQARGRLSGTVNVTFREYPGTLRLTLSPLAL